MIFMTTMLLKNLISNLKPEISKIKIKGISFDSRNVKKGFLFFSISGNKFNGNDYIEQAIKKGAKVIIHSKNIRKNKNAIFIKKADPRSLLAYMSTKFYQKKPKNIIAVTGTNGKSSIADFFHQINSLQKKNCGFIGTLGFKKNNILRKRELTTLDSLTLNKDLNDLKKNNIDNVIIEASSHGLKQKRLNFLKLKAGIFTNLSHDHLDYHKNMDDYLNSKLLLFRELLQKKASVITDTDIKEYKQIKKIQKNKKLKILTIGSKSNIFHVFNHKIFKNFQTLKIMYKKKIYKLRLNLYGSIQLKNLLMAILAANLCGCKIESIFKKVNKIKSVNGRLQLIRTLQNKSKIFLDYAHTPDALKNAILSIREHYYKKITIIFGCGGERDKTKRKLMAEVAKKYCDKIFVTDDNPRGESALKIRKQIVSALKNSNAKVKEIGNRKKAILYSLKKSDPYEIILIAGKGHENYQDLGNKKIYFSDKKIVKQFSDKNLKKQNQNIFKYNSLMLKNTLKLKKDHFFNGVSIDSKTLQKNNIFVAIKGKKNDGHNFLDEAKKRGARYCIISKKVNKQSKFIKVKDPLKFLKKFAEMKRNHSSAKYIGVTGSSGKTTVKTLLGKLLNNYTKTYFSPKSYNNHLGVPLSILNMKPDDNFGVFEIGMSRFNEIYNLSSLVKPHIAIITNVSEAHMENFKNLKEIAKAKGEIIYNIKKGGTIVLNRDDNFFKFFENIAKQNNIKIKSFGFSQKSDVRYIKSKKRKNHFIIKILVKGKKILLKTNNINKSYIMNILSCISVLDELNLDLSLIRNFFNTQSFLKGRGKLSKINKFNKKFFLIDESYNANPSSVKSAIENFSGIKKKQKRKYFLFGDMLELGKNSNFYHKKISNLINKSDIDKTFVYGKKAFETYKFLKKNKKGEVIKDLKNFNTKISKILKNGDFLMIKGSNGTRLHEVSKSLTGGLN